MSLQAVRAPGCGRGADRAAQPRHRPDPAGALSAEAARRRLRRLPVPRPALPQGRLRAAGVRAQPAAPTETDASSSPSATSAADRRASTRSGRSTTTGSAPSIAPSFGDIFYSNALKNGLLPIVLPEPAVAAHARGDAGARRAAAWSSISKRRSVLAPDGTSHAFDDRRVLEALPAERSRRARLHAEPRRPDRRLRASLRAADS